MNYLGSADFGANIRDYEFTRKARHQIQEVVSAESFEDMPPEDIFQFLLKRFNLVFFKDFLKRYLYERAGMTEEFSGIDDGIWQEIIQNAFVENNAPHSFEPTTTRWNATVKSWLTSDRVSRNTVLLIGFGLNMTERDVSSFLTRVLEEDDFRMNDPFEVICRYCFHHGLNYAAAKQLQDQFTMRLALHEQDKVSESLKNGSPVTPEQLQNEDRIANVLQDEPSLMRYLEELLCGNAMYCSADSSRKCFDDLYGRCLDEIVRIYNQDEQEKEKQNRKHWVREDVTASDLERMLCSGIPVTESGNLEKANISLLSGHFENYRPSRQRLNGILKGKAKPDRYDLCTLCFFLYSQKEEVSGEERLRAFLDEINQLLKSCNMSGLHPTNPYEAFLLICILSECPLAVYGDIWEMAYGRGEKEAI